MVVKRIPKLKVVPELEDAKKLNSFVSGIHIKDVASPLAINLLVVCGTLNSHLDLRYLYKKL